MDYQWKRSTYWSCGAHSSVCNETKADAVINKEVWTICLQWLNGPSCRGQLPDTGYETIKQEKQNN